ncbi:MAG: mismatch-specific DNA-glycosylase [Dehalococcoidia bacterium]|nr:mismatch-specific DNA-glycosylase [Dehalococcoidia bacterium]
MARDRRDPSTLPTLPDLIRPGLDLVFVGINPGERSAERGHYYGHMGNAFWRRLSASPLVSREVTCEDDADLAEPDPVTGLRIGFTDVVKRVLTDSSLVTREEFETSIPAFRSRIRCASPRAVCFTGTSHFQAVYPRSWVAGAWGLQDVPALEGAAVWVMPSPSGRASAHHGAIDGVLADLAESLTAGADEGSERRVR